MFTSVIVTNTLSHFVSLLEPPSSKAAQTKTSGLSTQWFIIQDLVGLSMAFATYSLPPTHSQSPVLFLTLLNSISLSSSTFSRRLSFLDAPACSGLRTPSFFPALFFFFFLRVFPVVLYIVTASFGAVGGKPEEKKRWKNDPRPFGLLPCRKYRNLSWPLS